MMTRIVAPAVPRSDRKRAAASAAVFATAFAAVLATLSGCASAPVVLSTAVVAPYADSVDMAGKLAVTYSRDGKDESLYGRFTWQQSALRTDVTITAPPLNQTVAAISVVPGLAILTQSGQAPKEAADIDMLSARALGWTLPVSGLRFWLQGHATDAKGRPFAASPAASEVITADGWRLHYVSWHDVATPGSPPQPKRIDVEHGATGNIDAMAIRIVLDPPEASQ